jgi:two-component system sensor histidine kinase DesK
VDERQPRDEGVTLRIPRSFPWATPPGADRDELRGARRRWFGGASFALLWQALVVISLWTDGGSLAQHVMGSASLFVVYAAYIAVPFVMWRGGLAVRVVSLAVFAALCGCLLLVIGPVGVWVWLLLASLTGFVAYRIWIALAINGLLIVAQLVVAALVGFGSGSGASSSVVFAPIVTASIAASMIIFGRQQETSQRLDIATDELTRLAVVEERARFSRDLHDVLGHSLTVVTMKSELAARLVDLDPERAKAEIRDIERLSREALQGLRQAVGGYREPDLQAELVSAKAALDAAGVVAELPDDATVVARDARSLFAWVLREGVTNVIRHAAATTVRVTITRSRLRVEDDGAGSAPTAPEGGNGLRGLRERAEAAGATLTTGTSALGGYLLQVERGQKGSEVKR